MTVLREQKMIPAEVLKTMKAFIDGSRWQFARTYARTFPHEYTSRKWQENQADYQRFAEQLVEFGFEEMWKGQWKTACIEIDGYKYWIMAEPGESIIMNRKPVAGYTEQEVLDRLQEIAQKKLDKAKAK